MRQAVLGVALAFTLLLAFLTLFVLVEHGPDLLTVVSLLVVSLFVFGIFGAFTTPPGAGK